MRRLLYNINYKYFIAGHVIPQVRENVEKKPPVRGFFLACAGNVMPNSVFVRGEIMTLQISRQHIDEAMELMAKPFFNSLEKLNGTAENGVNVPGYSIKELKAMAVTLKFAASCGTGAVSYEDESGVRYHVFNGDCDGANSLEANDKPATMIVSHMDTIPNGGHYDGGAGVAAGLCVAFAVAAHHKANGTQMDRPLIVAEFPCAESAEFGCAALGSKIATQQVSAEFVNRQTAQSDGKSLSHRMNDIGLDAAKICGNLTVGNKTLPTEHIGAAYEYHIARSDDVVDAAFDNAVQLDEKLAQQFCDLAAARGVKAEVRSCGVGHDAMVLTQQNIPASVILGKTPDADPFTAGAAFYEAVAALSDVVLNGPATERDKTPDGMSVEQALLKRGAMPL